MVVGMKRLLAALALLLSCTSTLASEGADGYFRMGETELRPRHAVAVVEEAIDHPAGSTVMLYMTAEPLDAAAVAAAFDPDAAVREQEPTGGYLRLCLDEAWQDCGMFYSPEGFNLGGYGELAIEHDDNGRIAGRFHLPQPGDFLGTAYEFDFRFDTVIVAAPGDALPAGGGEPGAAYNRYLQAVADGDFALLRSLAGEDGRWRFPEDDPSAARQSLKDARDGTPLQADVLRGRIDRGQATLWVRGIDRDGIARAGRVLMREAPQGWVPAEVDLESVD